MRLHGMTPGEIVAHVYSAFEPAPMWDADRLAGMNTETLPRLYCPACMKHGTIQRGDLCEPPRRNPDNGEKHASQRSSWYCHACKTWHRRPLVLRSRGSIGGTESRSARDKDWKIVDGIEAGKVMSAVESLPTAARCWTLWAHTQTGTPSMQNTLVECALVELDRSGMDRPKTFREGRAVLVMAIMVSEDSRERARNGRSLHTSASLSAAVRVSPSEMNRERRWGKLRDGLIAIYDALDMDMARAVIDSLRTPISDTA